MPYSANWVEVPGMSTEVYLWWTLLVGVSCVNLLAWSYAARTLRQRQGALPEPEYATRRLQLLFSAGYVLGCAYRSALPVFDVQRICLVDTWFSSVIVGRTVATIAELCFVAQWALLQRDIAHVAGSKAGRAIAMAVVPLIAIAETFSWYSVLTTSNFGHVIEESLWGVTAALLVANLLFNQERLSPSIHPFLRAVCLIGVGYVLYMFWVDVPMYWERWASDEAAGRHYLSLSQGIADASGRWIVSHDWRIWKTEVAWMTLYFSAAVWISIALVHAPPLKRLSTVPQPA
jgi:hypothetical protein